MIKESLKLLEISSTNFAPASVHAAISDCEEQADPRYDDYARDANDFYTKQVARIYLKYQQLLKQNNALDFDDLLLKTTDVYRRLP